MSPVLAVEVIKFGTSGEPAFRTTKFLPYLHLVAPFTFALNSIVKTNQSFDKQACRELYLLWLACICLHDVKWSFCYGIAILAETS